MLVHYNLSLNEALSSVVFTSSIIANVFIVIVSIILQYSVKDMRIFVLVCTILYLHVTHVFVLEQAISNRVAMSGCRNVINVYSKPYLFNVTSFFCHFYCDLSTPLFDNIPSFLFLQ